MRLPIKVIKKIYKPLVTPLCSKIIEAKQLIEQIRVAKKNKKYKPETIIYKSNKK
jgi:hypothetical protein